MRELGCIVPIPNRKQALDQAKRVFAQTGKFPAGICRFCGCTQNNACIDCYGDPCGWTDQTTTVCDAEACIEKYGAEQQAKEAQP